VPFTFGKTSLPPVDTNFDDGGSKNDAALS